LANRILGRSLRLTHSFDVYAFILIIIPYQTGCQCYPEHAGTLHSRQQGIRRKLGSSGELGSGSIKGGIKGILQSTVQNEATYLLKRRKPFGIGIGSQLLDISQGCHDIGVGLIMQRAVINRLDAACGLAELFR